MGAWQAGKRHGQGRCIYASGDQYQGDWQADERHGHGGCMYACGDKYKGKGVMPCKTHGHYINPWQALDGHSGGLYGISNSPPPHHPQPPPP